MRFSDQSADLRYRSPLTGPTGSYRILQQDLHGCANFIFIKNVHFVGANPIMEIETLATW